LVLTKRPHVNTPAKYALQNEYKSKVWALPRFAWPFSLWARPRPRCRTALCLAARVGRHFAFANPPVQLTRDRRVVSQLCSLAIANRMRSCIFVFVSRTAATNEKALRKRDARNVQALRLAHVSAGRGAPSDLRRSRKLEARGNREAVSPPLTQ
jgi:hypothetical protein